VIQPHAVNEFSDTGPGAKYDRQELYNGIGSFSAVTACEKGEESDANSNDTEGASCLSAVGKVNRGRLGSPGIQSVSGQISSARDTACENGEDNDISGQRDHESNVPELEHHNLHATSSEFSNTGTTTQDSASAPTSELDMHKEASITAKPLPAKTVTAKPSAKPWSAKTVPAKTVTAKSGLKPPGSRVTERDAIIYLSECRLTGIRADKTRVLGSAAYTKYLCGQPLE